MTTDTTAAADMFVGEQMHALLTELYPICRSLTGNGVRETLRILSKYVPIRCHEVPSGTHVFDWEIPKEWNIRDAYLADESGKRVVDFQAHNLHVVGYSVPVDAWMTLDELQPHLYSLPAQPDAIPYITSYYKPHWGFCLTHRNREALSPGRYHAVIESELTEGSLTYADFTLPGASSAEVLLSTYICHPSLANDDLSGVVLQTYLARWLQEAPRRYTYRFVYVPETIGSIAYLSRNIESMRGTVAGFSLTCVGDEGKFSFLPSPYGDTLADKVVLNVLRNRAPDFIRYSFLDRGSDERQYCSPGVDLPVALLMRSKFHMFPEYHTSLDDTRFVTARGLQGSFDLFRECIEAIESNAYYKLTCLGEPQLGKRGLYPNIGTATSAHAVRDMMNVIAYADGKNDLIDISNIIGVPVRELTPIVKRLADAGLLKRVNAPRDGIEPAP